MYVLLNTEKQLRLLLSGEKWVKFYLSKQKRESYE